MVGLQALKFLVVPPCGKHTATVIFVHGLGDTGAGWKPIADMFKNDDGLSQVKWVLPHAPVRPVTANMGTEMPSWFDIRSFGFDAEEDEDGMLETVSSLSRLISDEVDRGIPASRIVLGGFSQGGTMSLLTGLTTERKLAGIAVLSGWVPLKDKLTAMANAHAKSIPIFWGHGTRDPLVQFQFGRASADFLIRGLGVKPAEENGVSGLQFRGYDGLAHSANEEELDDLKTWLKRVLPVQKDE